MNEWFYSSILDTTTYLIHFRRVTHYVAVTICIDCSFLHLFSTIWIHGMQMRLQEFSHCSLYKFDVLLITVFSIKHLMNLGLFACRTLHFVCGCCILANVALLSLNWWSRQLITRSWREEAGKWKIVSCNSFKFVFVDHFISYIASAVVSAVIFCIVQVVWLQYTFIIC